MSGALPDDFVCATGPGSVDPLWIDIAFGQDAESKHLCQPEGIMSIVRILEPCVFLYGAGICEMNPISLGHQQINQPVPVVRRLDGDIGDVIFERPQGIDDDRWIVLELLVESTLTMLVDDAHIRIT